MKNSLTVPISIVLAGALIAGAVYLTRGGSAAGPTNPNEPTQEITVRPVDGTDHILGNPNAPIKIVEYSDTECPFCKSFHATMKQVMDTYGRDGKVAWVYRHFPLYKGSQPLHPKAGKQAEATECANELGGNDAFWKYLDRVYEITPSNNGLRDEQLPEIAQFAGVDVAAFNTCLASGKYADKISKDYDEALAAGAQGTPYSLIITEDNPPIPLEGAQPFSAVKTIIDTILAAGVN
jgi:protein-disulfide isomerase